MLVFGAIVLLVFVLNVAGVTTFVERRVWARMQSRIGPNRVGPQGFLQWLADGIKLLMKEDIVPTAADRAALPAGALPRDDRLRRRLRRACPSAAA